MGQHKSVRQIHTIPSHSGAPIQAGALCAPAYLLVICDSSEKLLTSVFTDHFLNVPLFAGCFFHLPRDRAYLNLLRLAFFLQACQLGPQTLLLQSGLMTHAEMFDMKSYIC